LLLQQKEEVTVYNSIWDNEVAKEGNDGKGSLYAWTGFKRKFEFSDRKYEAIELISH